MTSFQLEKPKFQDFGVCMSEVSGWIRVLNPALPDSGARIFWWGERTDVLVAPAGM